ncbi:DUF7021 domain-containing protein [Bacillus sp. FSL K6-2860]|uniref:DUF7021 domain-containing protein n=1 Tax=Bacillus sp. FSL K6-2860 TaxID=2921483 RepID=UPI0030FC780F
MKNNKQISAFKERFSAEIDHIIAVTGPSGVGAGKTGQESLWTASIPLIAWKELRPHHNRKHKALLVNR